MALRPRSGAFFRPNPGVSLTIGELSGELNTYAADLDIKADQLSDGQNMTRARASDSSLKKRGGISVVNQFLGPTTGILGGYNSLGRDGTQDKLIAYDTGLYYDNAGIWTALTGVTLTTNLKGEMAYYPITNKTYYGNGTDQVVKFTPGGSSGDQTDSSFKKGKYVLHYKNRLLVAGVATQEDYVWYTDLGVDTFGANNYFRVVGQIIGLVAVQDKVLIFTKNRIYRLMNFVFDGLGAGPDRVDELPVSFGSIAQRTIKTVNNMIYFLGQDVTNKASVYVTDGYQAQSLSDLKISSTLNGLSPSQLTNACAAQDGFLYHLACAAAGKFTNTMGIKYDTNRGYFYPVEKRFLDNRAEFSVMWSSETNGQWEVYAGTQGTGQVYKLNSNDGLFDELGEERYLTAGSYNVAIDASPAKRAAQSFKMTQYQNSQTVNVTQAALQLKKTAGTTTNLTVRLETDNNGKPSGTLVTSSATATIIAFSATSYAWKQAVFAAAIPLLGNTSYWLVLQHSTEGSGNSQYHWLGDSCTATYTPGNLATYATGVTASTDTYLPDSSALDVTLSDLVPSPYASFATIRGAATANLGFDHFINPQIRSQGTGNSWDSLSRVDLAFNTSALPTGATITSAILKLYITSTTDDLSQSLGLTSASPASTTTKTGTDYAVANFGSTRFATDLALAALSLNSYASFTLNASGLAGITKAGITKFGLRLSGDIDNSEPTHGSGTTQSSVVAQSSTGANPPQLVVTYTIAGGTSGWTADPITDQTFVLYGQSPIDGYFDTKSFLVADGREVQLDRFAPLFNTVGNYNVEIAFANLSFATVTPYLFSLAGPSSSWTWGDGVSKWGEADIYWGATSSQGRTYQWIEVNSLSGRTIKMRVRNRNANQQVEFNRAELALSPMLSQT